MRIRPGRFLLILIANAISLSVFTATSWGQYSSDDDSLPPPSYRGFYQAASYEEQSDAPPAPIVSAQETPVGSGYCENYSDGAEYLPHACRACDRWYVAISGGTASRQRAHEITDARTFIEFDTGFAANAALGYRFDMFRVEVETSFMNNACATAGAAGFASATTGNVNLKAFMFNAYHDFEFQNWRWKPYVGAGLGIYQSEINGLYPDFFAGAPAPFPTTPVNATSNMPFAYQFRAGISRPIGERTEFFAGYRYFHGETLTFAAAPFASPAAPTFNPNAAIVHAAEIGLRIRF